MVLGSATGVSVPAKAPGGGRRHATALHGFSPILGAVGLINWTGLPIAAVENSKQDFG